MTIISERGHEAADAAEDRVIVVCGDEVWSGEIKRLGKDRYYVEVQTDAVGKPHRYRGGLAALRDTWRRLDTGEVLDEASADEPAAALARVGLSYLDAD
jgi:hypothetical protein